MQVRLTPENTKKAKVHAAFLDLTVPAYINSLVEKAEIPKSVWGATAATASNSQREALTRYCAGEE